MHARLMIRFVFTERFKYFSKYVKLRFRDFSAFKNSPRFSDLSHIADITMAPSTEREMILNLSHILRGMLAKRICWRALIKISQILVFLTEALFFIAF